MRGSLAVPFSELVVDTIKAHGITWAAQYYAKRGLPLWQFLIFARPFLKPTPCRPVCYVGRDDLDIAALNRLPLR